MQARDASHAKGVDVSWYQGVIDWVKVNEAGYNFAFVKVSEGSTMTDSNYLANLTGAKMAGLLVSGYHFLHARNEAEAVKEADLFLSRIASFEKLDMPPVIDIEVSYLKKSAIRVWIDRVYQVLGVKPLIYTNAMYLDSYLSSGEFNDCPLWYAMYGNDHPADRGGWNEWMFFQYSEKGQVPGINAYVDLNEFAGSVEDMFGFKMSLGTANAMIQICKTHYDLAVTAEEKEAWHIRANEIRKASGQQEE